MRAARLVQLSLGLCRAAPLEDGAAGVGEQDQREDDCGRPGLDGEATEAAVVGRLAQNFGGWSVNFPDFLKTLGNNENPSIFIDLNYFHENRWIFMTS